MAAWWLGHGCSRCCDACLATGRRGQRVGHDGRDDGGGVVKASFLARRGGEAGVGVDAGELRVPLAPL